MNFLGHSRFSIETDMKTLYGNFAGDFYKGRIETLHLPKNVENGVRLHRRIDSVSDDDNILSREISAEFKLFRGVISDIFIDHFLALNWHELFGEKLEEDIKKIYFEIEQYSDLHTQDFKRMYSWIKENNILYSYRNPEAIKQTFNGISKRVRNGGILNLAYDELMKKYEVYQIISIKEFQRVREIISGRK